MAFTSPQKSLSPSTIPKQRVAHFFVKHFNFLNDNAAPKKSLALPLKARLLHWRSGRLMLEIKTHLWQVGIRQAGIWQVGIVCWGQK